MTVCLVLNWQLILDIKITTLAEKMRGASLLSAMNVYPVTFHTCCGVNSQGHYRDHSTTHQAGRQFSNSAVKGSSEGHDELECGKICTAEKRAEVFLFLGRNFIFLLG